MREEFCMRRRILLFHLLKTSDFDHLKEVYRLVLSNDTEEKPQLEPTVIYRCKDADCKAWVREDYVTTDKSCPICKGQMLRSIKHLPPAAKARKKRATSKTK